MTKSIDRGRRELLIDAVTRQGESVRAAAERLGVAASTAYGWMRVSKAGRASTPTPGPTFVELVPAARSATALVVRVGIVEIEVRAGFDAAVLRAVVDALSGSAA